MNLAGTLVWGEKRKNVIKTQVFQIHTYILIFTSDIYIVAKIKQKNLLHKSLPKEAKNEKVNSTHLSPGRFYFCTVDIFSFTFLMVCLELLLTAMEGVYYE